MIAAREAAMTTAFERSASISFWAIAADEKANVITAPQIAALKRNAIRTP
jgi:hypothetical protein